MLYRRLFLSILVVVAFVTTSKWCNLDAQDLDSIIFSGGGSWGGGNKSPGINDLQISVLNFLGTKLLVVTVQSNLGMVDFTITNHNTGEYLDGELNAQPGSYPIPISGSAGNYTALFILPDGRRIEREFVI